MMLVDPPPNRTYVERAGNMKCPGERPTTFGKVEAAGVRMHIRTTARQPDARIGNQLRR